jgi:hypothetical protein
MQTACSTGKSISYYVRLVELGPWSQKSTWTQHTSSVGQIRSTLSSCQNKHEFLYGDHAETWRGGLELGRPRPVCWGSDRQQHHLTTYDQIA